MYCSLLTSHCSLLLFLDFSIGHLIIIFFAVFVLFGPKKIPEIARKLAKFINDLKKAADRIKNEINEETSDIKKEIDDVKKKTSDYIG